ncbi:MAG: putative porin [Cytophagales bacterium]|nr:putative porin [Bernardetiaceae bacterium]MDW8204808.1 putative porin [Cytophagales bacterium]
MALAQDNTNRNSTSKKDSIRYGPHTTRYYYWHTLYHNIDDTLYIDTAYANRHRYNLVQKNNNMWQDLGVFGTAAQPIFYREPEQIGTRLGYNSLAPYRLHRDEVRYFDSYSPVTDLDYIQGGKGRTRLRVTHARSITPEASAAIFFQRQEANKILGRNSRRNDPMLTNQGYGTMARFFSRDLRYKLLAHFLYSEHAVQENGGYNTNELSPSTSHMLANLPPQELAYSLEQVVSREKVYNFHLYQQLDLPKDSLQQIKQTVQLFHQLEWLRQANEYVDENLLSNFRNFYRRLPFNVAQWRGRELRYATHYQQLDNRAGIKGQWHGLRYRTYLRNRIYSFQANYTDVNTLADSAKNVHLAPEWFAGAVAQFAVYQHHSIDAEAEVQLPLQDYRTKIIYHNKWFKGTWVRTVFSPDLTQRHVFGSFFKWANPDFYRTISDRLNYETGFIPVPFIKKYLSFAHFAGFENIQNFVYYDTAGIARQTTEGVRLLHAGLHIRAQWKDWQWHTQIRYSQNIGEDVFRVPPLLINSQLFIQKKFFAGELDGQLGLDFHWKSAFYANAFMPATQQFILNNRYLTDGYPVLDLFFNFKISRALLFVKLTNMLQDIAGKAYFNTPRYFAQPRSLEIGINWLFFD